MNAHAIPIAAHDHRCIVIIGGGPRGINVLERLTSHARASGSALDIDLVEPADLGVGLHHVDQAPYLLLNTVACELTMFTDPGMISDAPITTGQNFHEWLTDNGWTVDAGAYLPRCLLGKYLAWAASNIVKNLPSQVTVRHHRTTAVDIANVNNTLCITLQNGTRLWANGVILTIGHGSHAAPPTPYPLEEAVRDIDPGKQVVVAGTGLTASDIITTLTTGRRGKYVAVNAKRLHYHSSGEEPKITLFSRSGHPARARPRYDPARKPLSAKIFRSETIAMLRRLRPLDFTDDILPLIVKEMEYRWSVFGGGDSCPDFFGILTGKIAESPFGHARAYQSWFINELEFDLNEADRGLGISPFKEAIEVLRDHRGILRTALVPGTLRETSRHLFYTNFSGISNRLVNGPDPSRQRELLALIEAGVVTPGPGPGSAIRLGSDGATYLHAAPSQACSIRVDHVVRAYLPVFSLADHDNPLLRRLVARGILTPAFQGPSSIGVQVDSQHRAVGINGDPHPGLFVLGPLAEGSSFYNHYIASPKTPSRVIMDADSIARSVLY